MSPAFRRIAPALLLLLVTLAPARAAVTLSTLHTFNTQTVGNNPNDVCKLLLASDGNYYGTTLSGGSNNLGTVYQLTPAGALTIVHSFTNNGDGYTPAGSLIQGADGKLYGTVNNGGAGGRGEVFKVNTNGTGFATVYAFTGSTTDGGSPNGGVVQDSSGSLYGATLNYGANGNGTIYKVKTDGTGFKDLHDFISSSEGNPEYYSLILNGTTLYGVLNGGGPTGYGSLFSITTAGTGFAIVHAFTASTDGAYPRGIILGADGKLYGSTYQSGPGGYGTVYKVSTTGTGFTVLKAFDNTNTGGYVVGTLSQDSSGILYGGTQQGGPSSNDGTVFKLHTDGSNFLVLHTFATDGHEGDNNGSGVIVAADGSLIGTRYAGGSISRNTGTIFGVNKDGTGFHLVYDLSAGRVEGFNTYSGLVRGSDGNFYGVTRYGGWYDDGTLFKMTPAGVVTVLHNFAAGASDGDQPFATLVQDSSGNFYGSTYYGGTYNEGTVFQLKANGTYTLLYVFGQTGGSYIPSSLLVGADGLLYGTSYYGGQYNNGAVFRLTLDGYETVIHSFKGGTTEGQYANSGLLQLADGTLYGTTFNGGTNNQGTVYKLNVGGSGFATLHSFTAATDGANPDAGLILGTDGKLYGTTSVSGPANGGTLYNIATNGSGYHVVHQFGASTDGSSPNQVMQATDGRLYGTANTGGPNSVGTAWRMTTTGGSFTVLNAFINNGTQGYNPGSPLLEAPDGNVYGTTYAGGPLPFPGTTVGGTVFSLNTLLPIITAFTPAHGAAGTLVTITGTNFIAPVTVKFGPVPGPNVTVVSSTKLTVKVPAGAVTARITVTTSKGTATSTTQFAVP